MATIVYGREGDDVIVTRVDFGHGDEYLVERRYGMGYFAEWSTFDMDKAIARARNAE